jgi:hypothetical protein
MIFMKVKVKRRKPASVAAEFTPYNEYYDQHISTKTRCLECNYYKESANGYSMFVLLPLPISIIALLLSALRFILQ